jgi:tetratricopeptide (TPR) repeat protein
MNQEKFKNPEGQYWNIALGVILLLTLACLWSTLNNESVNYDDDTFVFQNELVTQPVSETIGRMFTEGAGGNYHPLTTLSLALNYSVSKTEAYSYHLINLLLHLLNTALVFMFVRLLTKNNFRIAIVTALFFGIHPMHVESVAWIVERKDVLFACFYMGSMLLYLRYRDRGSPAVFGAVLLTGVMAMLSKPAAVTLPMALLLIDYFLDGKFVLKKALRHLPLFLLAVCIGIATVTIQADQAIGDVTQYSFFQKIGFASYGIVFYTTHAFVPMDFSVMHPYPDDSKAWGLKLLVSALVILALIALWIWKGRKNRYLFFGSCFFVLNLLLVLQFLSVGRAIVAERYTYLPYVGLFFMVGYLWDWLTEQKQYKSWATGLSGGLAVLAVYSLAATWQQSKVWQTSETLWAKTIEVYPKDWYAYIGRGNYYRDSGKLQDALVDYNKAIQLNPKNFENYFNRGGVYRQLNQLDLAIADYSQAIYLKPDHAEAYVNRGQFYTEAGRYNEALTDLNTAIQLDASIPSAYCNRGNVYLAANQLDNAMADYNKALSLNNKLYEAWYNRGNAYSAMKKYQKAIADFSAAIQLDPKQSNAYNNRGSAYFQAGDLQGALNAYDELVNHFPNFADGWMNRSIVHFQLGNKANAYNDAVQAQQLGKDVSADYLKQLKQ